jgi:hypothetical protein
MSAARAGIIEEIERRGSISDADVLKLRAAFYGDGAITREEAEALIGLNDAVRVRDASWADFYVEAISDYLVNDAAPKGYIVTENAEWLIEAIDRDGKVDGRTELELLVTALDKARWSPTSLVHYALEQIRRAVLEGEGPSRAGEASPPGTIDEGEVELIRRILYAFGGDGSVAVTRAEAEVLFEINDAVAGAPPSPAWTDLFAKAIANVVMATSGYAVPTREEALRHETWLESRDDLSPAAMLKGMVSAGLGAVWGGYRKQSSEERALARLERQRIEIITNEAVTEGEVEWLAERIGRDGKVTDSEAALIAFLKKEGPHLAPALGLLVERLSAAA